MKPKFQPRFNMSHDSNPRLTAQTGISPFWAAAPLHNKALHNEIYIYLLHHKNQHNLGAMRTAALNNQ